MYRPNIKYRSLKIIKISKEAQKPDRSARGKLIKNNFHNYFEFDLFVSNLYCLEVAYSQQNNIEPVLINCIFEQFDCSYW